MYLGVINMDQVNIQKGEVISETHSQMFSHFVKVRLIFMNKEFIEEYPIQDQDYSAARVFNQNLVNKALQRAKAKVASRATGLGFKLYEGKDLQFDDVPSDTKPEIPVVTTETKPVEEKKAPKTTKTTAKTEKVEEKPVEVTENVQPVVEASIEVEAEKVENVETKNDPVLEIIDLIKNTEVDKMNLALQRVNVSLMKKHKIAISTEASEDELKVLLSNKEIFKDPSQLLKTLKTLLGA